METLRNMRHIVTPIAAAVLAAVMAHLNQGCSGQQLRPEDAYGAELSACAATRNASVLQCAEEASTKAESQECRSGAEKAYESCRDSVDRKYGL